MKNLKLRFQRYVGIFHGIRLPWLILAVVLFLKIANSHLELGSATLTAGIIDGSQQAIDISQLIRYIVVMLGTALMGMVILYSENWAYEKINTGVRVKLWRKLMGLPTRYYDGEASDTLISRVTTDSSQSYIYFQVAIESVTAVYAAVVSIQQMYRYSPELTRYTLWIIPGVLLLAWGFGKLNLIAGRKTQRTFSETMRYLAERTRNLRLIKAARTECAEETQGKTRFQKQFRASWWVAFSNSSQVMIIELLSCIFVVVTFLFGRNLVNAGVITVGRLIGFYSIATMMSVRLITLFQVYGYLKQANGQLEKISEILDAEEEKRDGVEFDVEDADIIAEDLSFSYGDTPTLEHVSFHIPKGQITAIVGANGAGKSTLFKLFERMYDPDEGALRFGHDDVRTFSLDSWRRSFAIVSQDKPLLSGTVRENILYGVKRQVTDEELEEVARLANVYDFVMATPGGFDAPVGMGGSNFSGGQRQCIAIARAMMRNPDYLLLDEATASLDAKSEQIVSQALTNLMKGRTTIMIAHNYSATRDATHIVVMKDGRVEAEGSPEELQETNEYYRAFAGQATA